MSGRGWSRPPIARQRRADAGGAESQRISVSSTSPDGWSRSRWCPNFERPSTREGDVPLPPARVAAPSELFGRRPRPHGPAGAGRAQLPLFPRLPAAGRGQAQGRDPKACRRRGSTPHSRKARPRPGEAERPGADRQRRQRRRRARRSPVGHQFSVARPLPYWHALSRRRRLAGFISQQSRRALARRAHSTARSGGSSSNDRK